MDWLHLWKPGFIMIFGVFFSLHTKDKYSYSQSENCHGLAWNLLQLQLVIFLCIAKAVLPEATDLPLQEGKGLVQPRLEVDGVQHLELLVVGGPDQGGDDVGQLPVRGSLQKSLQFTKKFFPPGNFWRESFRPQSYSTLCLKFLARITKFLLLLQTHLNLNVFIYAAPKYSLMQLNYKKFQFIYF